MKLQIGTSVGQMVILLDWPTGTVWNHNLVSLLANLMQYRLANERVSPSESDWPIKWCPIPIRLANGVPICGPMQHQLANKSLSPSQSDWPMGYLFVVPCNTGWPTNHCPHPNQVGQWGTYLWSNTSWPVNHCPHLNQSGQWGTYLWSHTTPVGQSIGDND